MASLAAYMKYNPGIANMRGLDYDTRHTWMNTSQAFDLLFERFHSEAKVNGIIFVTSAGNSGVMRGSKRLGVGDQMPQDRGTRDNEIITVGAIYPDGTLWEGGSPRGARVGPQGAFVQNPDNALLSSYPDLRLGWIDIYAPGFQVLVPSSRDGDMVRTGGTSVSTALVVSTLHLKGSLPPPPPFLNKLLTC